MKGRYLEITYRKGKPLAGYLYLPRLDGDVVARSEPSDGGLVLDYATDGRIIGIELLAPGTLALNVLNNVLGRLSLPPLTPADAAPLGRAA